MIVFQSFIISQCTHRHVCIVFAYVWITGHEPNSLPELTLFMKHHDWPLLGHVHHISLMLSSHPADPTLTTDNLMEVVKEVEHRWEDLGHKLGLRTDNLEVHGMAVVVDEYVRHYPTPSWKKVATALQKMELDKLADEVTTKYVRGMDVNHVTCLIQKLSIICDCITVTY